MQDSVTTMLRRGRMISWKLIRECSNISFRKLLKINRCSKGTAKAFKL
jgi:hypothetical protein